MWYVAGLVGEAEGLGEKERGRVELEGSGGRDLFFCGSLNGPCYAG